MHCKGFGILKGKKKKYILPTTPKNIPEYIGIRIFLYSYLESVKFKVLSDSGNVLNTLIFIAGKLSRIFDHRCLERNSLSLLRKL